MEACLGMQLLETTSGGLRGGSSRLSLAALDLVERYQHLRAGLDELVLDRFESGFRDLAI
jgi:molybdate transport repressor ModE-like protein